MYVAQLLEPYCHCDAHLYEPEMGRYKKLARKEVTLYKELEELSTKVNQSSFKYELFIPFFLSKVYSQFSGSDYLVFIIFPANSTALVKHIVKNTALYLHTTNILKYTLQMAKSPCVLLFQVPQNFYP